VPLLSAPGAQVEHLVTGAGEPVTIFAHGVGASIAETRPLGTGVPGTKIFLSLRGHGATTVSDGRWDYAALAGDLRAVADATGATQALGVSMGAAALLHLLADDPDRFERCVFFLPAVLDRPRSDLAFDRLRQMADLVQADDAEGLSELLLAELPAELRRDEGARRYTAQRARTLAGTDLAHLLRGLPPLTPIRDRAQLAAVRAPTLVVGQEGDDVHPASVARELAAALPGSALHVFPRDGAMWLDRGSLRAMLAGFLGAATAGRLGQPAAAARASGAR